MNTSQSLTVTIEEVEPAIRAVIKIWSKYIEEDFNRFMERAMSQEADVRFDIDEWTEDYYRSMTLNVMRTGEGFPSRFNYRISALVLFEVLYRIDELKENFNGEA